MGQLCHVQAQTFPVIVARFVFWKETQSNFHLLSWQRYHSLEKIQSLSISLLDSWSLHTIKGEYHSKKSATLLDLGTQHYPKNPSPSYHNHCLQLHFNDCGCITSTRALIYGLDKSHFKHLPIEEYTKNVMLSISTTPVLWLLPPQQSSVYPDAKDAVAYTANSEVVCCAHLGVAPDNLA